jgi:RNA polymerase sigma factor (sigma-70 family)
VSNPAHEDPEQVAEAPSLEFLFEQALRQDKEALKHLFTLINTRHYKQITAKLKGLGTGAGNATREDVFQDTVITLMEKLEAGEITDLKEEDRKDILGYFQKLCYGRLKDVVRKRKSPVLQRHKPQIPKTFADRGAKIPGEQRYTEYLSLIDYAASRLSPEHAAILRMYLDRVPYEEMARVTGKKVETLRNLIVRLKGELQLDIVPRSDTAELHYKRGQKGPGRAPSWEEIDEAISLLPIDTQQAIRFVHVENHSADELARKLGDRGAEKARARLKKGHEILSGNLGVDFPDAFNKAGPRPSRKRLTRGEIEAAVDKLPAINKDAFLFVHVEGHSVEELADRIGDDDTTRAQGRLDDAYRILNQRLNELFPEAYEQALDA